MRRRCRIATTCSTSPFSSPSLARRSIRWRPSRPSRPWPVCCAQAACCLVTELHADSDALALACRLNRTTNGTLSPGPMLAPRPAAEPLVQDRLNPAGAAPCVSSMATLSLHCNVTSHRASDERDICLTNSASVSACSKNTQVSRAVGSCATNRKTSTL